jgi:hypothetical protein
MGTAQQMFEGGNREVGRAEEGELEGSGAQKEVPSFEGCGLSSSSPSSFSAFFRFFTYMLRFNRLIRSMKSTPSR